VQNLILKNEGKISIGITIDGIKEKHDLQERYNELLDQLTQLKSTSN